MNRMISIRKYQFIGFIFAGFFYFYVYRKFLFPKTIMNSVVYHNSVKFIDINPTVKKVLGDNLNMMNCNGK